MGLHPISDETGQRLSSAGLDVPLVAAIVESTILEDLAGGVDVTSKATVPADLRGTADFAVRAAGCLAGLDVAIAVVETVCGPCTVERRATDGAAVAGGDVVARVSAPLQSLLTAERSALNLLCHLSGVATATRRWVEAIVGTAAVVRDTRKTTPGLRMLEKYAVRCGGGRNHRMSLSDAALVKDNHIAAAGGVVEAFRAVRAGHPDLPLEVEVDTLDQLRAVISAGADVVLLDNMATATMREAVALVAAHVAGGGQRVILEASGGLTLERAREVAETGVDCISVGAITHSAPILDIALDVVTVG